MKKWSVAGCQRRGRQAAKVLRSTELATYISGAGRLNHTLIQVLMCKNSTNLQISSDQNPTGPPAPLENGESALAPLVPSRVENDSSLSVDLLGIAAWSQIVILSRWMLCQHMSAMSMIQDYSRSQTDWNTACFTHCCQDWTWFLGVKCFGVSELQLSFLGTFPSQFLCFFELWDFYGFLRFSSQEGKILRLTLVCRYCAKQTRKQNPDATHWKYQFAAHQTQLLESSTAGQAFAAAERERLRMRHSVRLNHSRSVSSYHLLWITCSTWHLWALTRISCNYIPCEFGHFTSDSAVSESVHVVHCSALRCRKTSAIFSQMVLWDSDKGCHVFVLQA